MTPGSQHARFDDLVAGRALRCPAPHRVLVADRPAEVVPLLAEVERATTAGDWAYGYLGHGAAAGLDPALAVQAGSGDGPPPAWFALCGAPADVPPRAHVDGDPADLYADRCPARVSRRARAPRAGWCGCRPAGTAHRSRPAATG